MMLKRIGLPDEGSLFLLFVGKGHYEAGSAGVAGVEYDIATQTAGDASCHAETDACSVIVGVELGKLFEDAF